MPKNDPATQTALLRGSDMALALSLLTRLPVTVGDASRGARAAWAYPLVGIVTGGLAALIGLLAMTLGLGAPIAALLALGVGIAVTGALHEDGLADCADGFWGGWTRERRLEIMRDSRIGTYGVLAILLSFGLRWAALSAIFDTGEAATALLGAAVVSRAVMPPLMCAMQPARPGGLSHHVGQPGIATAVLAVGLATIAALLILGSAALAALLGAALAAIAVGMIAQAKIGGQSGDVLGAAQQLAEIMVLLVLLL